MRTDADSRPLGWSSGYICLVMYLFSKHSLLTQLIYDALWHFSLVKDFIDHTQYFPKWHKVGGLLGPCQVGPSWSSVTNSVVCLFQKIKSQFWGEGGLWILLEWKLIKIFRLSTLSGFCIPRLVDDLNHLYCLFQNVAWWIFYARSEKMHMRHNQCILQPSALPSRGPRGFYVTQLNSCSQS